MNLTPEQMNEATSAAFDSLWNGELTREEVAAALSAALPVLFAAWQEQTAAKAGENPVPDEAGAHAQQAWDEGAMYPDRSSE